ncbi:glutathione S-transferase 1-like [Styela clava]|uniref:glutathione S-transferase 1-like n=1 Tax=Styela clava TaxID=7725 RepID=UPI001939BB8F|nr:glutathione S-transferase 1-like [Styela clava]
MSAKTKIDFYTMDTSPPCRAVWMVLEELGIPYNEHYVNVMKGEQKTAEYQKISFRQKVPAIKDGEFCLAESRAVAAYLISEYGENQKKQHLYPQDNKSRAKMDQHLYIGENITDSIVNYVNPGGVLFRGEQTRHEKLAEMKNYLGMIERMLADHTYTTADNLTVADFFYYIAVTLLNLTDFKDFDDFPKLVAWRKKMEALPYHKKTCDEPLAKFREAYQAKLKENAAKKC